MNSISQSLGSRIRTYRQEKGYSQELLAEKADVHPTYIGQIERGEKNITVATLEKVLNALEISFLEFFQCMETIDGKPSYAVQCYDLVHKRKNPEQARMYHILWEVDQLMEAARLGLAGK